MADIGWWSTHLGEEEISAANAAMQDRGFSMGGVTAALERDIAKRLGAGHAVVVPSGSAALLVALMALEVGVGDEVIVPDVTWIATAHAARLLGADVRLAETLADRPVMDTARLPDLVNDRTKAILPVHVNGRAVDMKPLLALAEERGIAVVEDAAQALGSRTAVGYLGTLGAMGVYSLSLTKLVSVGQGGVVVTNDDALYERLLSVRTHGVANYGFEERYLGLGFNFKVSDVLSAIGRVQFSRLDEKVAHVKAVYAHYCEGLDGINGLRIIPVDVEGGEVPLWTEVLCDDRRAVMAHLGSHGIKTRPYHPALHTAPHLPDAVDHSNASRFGECGLVLPSGPSQPLDAVRRTIAALKSSA